MTQPAVFSARWATVFLLLFTIGCGGGPDQKTSENAETDGAGSARVSLQKRKQCQANLEKVYQILYPSAETIDSELQSALVILNQWFGSCAEMSDATISKDDPSLAGLPVEGLIEYYNKSIATIEDISYVRDQLLSREIVGSIVQTAPTDLEKVRSIFDHIIRNVSIDSPLIDPRLINVALTEEEFNQLTPEAIPRTLIDIILAGRGTVRDRLWLTTAILQQLQFPSAVFSASAGDQEAPLLLVVPVGDKLLLLCPELGIEIPGATEAGWDPAKVRSGISDALNSLPEGAAEKSPQLKLLQDADWTQAKVWSPIPLIASSPRMEALQLDFVGDMACELYLPSAGNQEAESGAWATVQKLAGKETITRWNYPTLMYRGTVSVDEAANRARQLYLATLFKEVESSRTSEDENENRSLTVSLIRQMLKARFEQVVGNRTRAMQIYIKIRLQGRVGGESGEAIVENVLRFLQSEDAIYWSALCQFENEAYDSAANTLENYILRYTQGRWVPEAKQIFAEALLNDGRKAEAIQVLESAELKPSQEVRKLQHLQKWKSEN